MEPSDAETEPSWNELEQAATNAAAGSHARYSGFHVGCALEDENGQIWVGANVENAAYTGIHAEGGALSAWAAGRGSTLRRAVVVAIGNDQSPRLTLPCGSCRQALYEYGGASLRLLTSNGERTLGALLPEAFGADELT